MLEFANVRTDIRVRRWDATQTEWVARHSGILVPEARHFDALDCKPYHVTEAIDVNLVTRAGWAALLGGVAGTTIGNKFSSTAGRIGVGTISTAATSADVQLGGDTGTLSTTSYYALCGVAPTITTSVTPATLVFTASYGSAIANFAWNEFGIDNYTASSVTTVGTSSVFFNHGISAQGTKTSGQTWNMTVTLNFGFPSGAGTVN